MDLDATDWSSYLRVRQGPQDKGILFLFLITLNWSPFVPDEGAAAGEPTESGANGGVAGIVLASISARSEK